MEIKLIIFFVKIIPIRINIRLNIYHTMPDALKRIKKMRHRLGLTQSELAELADVSQSLITKIERGKIEPSYSLAKKILSTLEEQLAGSQQGLQAKDICVKKIISVKSDDKIKDALNKMIKNAISQMPVLKGNIIVGSISEESFIKKFNEIKDESVTVEKIMDEAFPTVPEDANISLIKELLDVYNAVLVFKNGKPIGIISKTDLLKTHPF